MTNENKYKAHLNQVLSTLTVASSRRVFIKVLANEIRNARANGATNYDELYPLIDQAYDITMNPIALYQWRCVQAKSLKELAGIINQGPISSFILYPRA